MLESSSQYTPVKASVRVLMAVTFVVGKFKTQPLGENLWKPLLDYTDIIKGLFSPTGNSSMERLTCARNLLENSVSS